MRSLFLVLFLFIPSLNMAASMDPPLEKVTINPRDKASLQRGAKTYMDYCLGCHSLEHIRYQRMAKDIGIVDADGKINEQRLKTEFIYTGAKSHDTIKSAFDKAQATQWFGNKVPDLTLVARVRGVDWLYTYLRSFYEDVEKPWGVNNRVFPDVAMPHVLVSLQGVQRPVYRTEVRTIDGEQQEVEVIDHLELGMPGLLSPQEYDALVTDLVNFLAYVAVPERVERERLGVWVLGFLVVFAVLTYLLQREYWRDIKKK